MSTKEISLVAVEVKKWDLETNKISMSSYYVIDNEEHNSLFEVSILQPAEMCEEFLGKLRFECEQNLRASVKKGELSIAFDNEAFIRQKVSTYFKRITNELNNPKRKQGQPRMILTTHMDVYNENQDISFLPKSFQFFIILNWARKYYNREDYKKSIEPLRQLIKVRPKYGRSYQMLAKSLKKIRKFDEAMRNYEKFANIEKSTEGWLELAKSYRKGKLFEKSSKIYDKILKKEPQNKEALIGKAQILYANVQPEYEQYLDQLYEADPKWLREWLKDEFNFRIYVNKKQQITPLQATKYLGYNKIFELTERAFRNEIPSHFNPTKARMNFYKEELENWANSMNKYKCFSKKIELFPERIDDEDVENQMDKPDIVEEAEAAPDPSKKISSLDAILQEIRAKKAARLAEEERQAMKPKKKPYKPKKYAGNNGKSKNNKNGGYGKSSSSSQNKPKQTRSFNKHNS